jgi:uncharacterized protein (DUF1684 family)
MENDYQAIRLEKDTFFAQDSHSPLTKTQRQDFKGLNYFAPDEALRLTLELHPLAQPAAIEMQTSTGDLRQFYKVGKFTFQIDGEPAELTLYQNEFGYFLPFVDAQAGKSTYPAGRYLDPEPVSAGKFLVDFNLAYNPYCAYNDAWSCPLPPAENRLKVAIRAGEMLFHEPEGE